MTNPRKCVNQSCTNVLYPEAHAKDYLIQCPECIAKRKHTRGVEQGNLWLSLTDAAFRAKNPDKAMALFDEAEDVIKGVKAGGLEEGFNSVVTAQGYKTVDRWVAYDRL